jgi:uncharacterized protein YbaP (TraB family)
MPPKVKILACRLLLFVLCFGFWADPAPAEPALWSIQQGGSTIYLFGTIHVWKSDREWESAKIADALDASAELWTELLDDDAKTMAPLIAKFGFDHIHPLSSKLSKQEVGLIAKEAKALELPDGAARFEPMRPWLVALTLSVAPLMRAGYDPAQGIDHVLQAQARAYGKHLRAFESADMQIHLFADLPPAIELEMLRSALEETKTVSPQLDAIAAAWAAGDVPALETSLLESDEKKYADFYKRLFVDRNQAWADRIVARLKEARGTSFVAVGAGHLAGPDSLQKALEQRGVTVMRD